MAGMSITSMQALLTKSISSFNQNKLNGLLAEGELRQHLSSIGFSAKISLGGWICRSVGEGKAGLKVAAFFPESLPDGSQLVSGRTLPTPPGGLHAVCSLLHSAGIASYFCALKVSKDDDIAGLSWSAMQLGTAAATTFVDLSTVLKDLFGFRGRPYNPLRYNTDASLIPVHLVTEEFLKEFLRVKIQTTSQSEMSDIDGVFFGAKTTYPLEIKEKTVGNDKGTGDYFGLDVGPFVKLAFYAANRNTMDAMFVVREIDNAASRNLKNWWFITFNELAKYASWTPISGGTNMRGGGSSVIKIPKYKFRELNSAQLSAL